MGPSVCWHCAEPISEHAVKHIPYEYDQEQKVYLVMGAVCSFSCAKGFYYEKGSHACSSQLRLVDDLYRATGGEGSVSIAPPRCNMIKYGGIEDMSSQSQEHAYVRSIYLDIIHKLVPVYFRGEAESAIQSAEPLLLTTQNATDSHSMSDLFRQYIESRSEQHKMDTQ